MASKPAQVVLSPRFRAELKHQISWIAARNLSAARAAETRVRVALRRLRRFPDLGRPGRVEYARTQRAAHALHHCVPRSDRCRGSRCFAAFSAKLAARFLTTGSPTRCGRSSRRPRPPVLAADAPG
ncbi:MAG: type II toxin-antitoxin system RelE/ParE family toxin [Phycisphaerales bacterium]|nr:type II toxin-antitoxin system RelE/ParE family toxin [Hyphomonadaceae bacterium]